MTPKKTIGEDRAERINIFLPPEVLTEVKINAENVGLSVSAYIRTIIIQSLKQK